MKFNHIFRLHWKLFIPLVGLLWLIIGINFIYFVSHEKHRQKENLENRLLNVNNTVVSAYEHGADLQKTVDFIKLFTNRTTLDPLRLTVYDDNRVMIADNPEKTISLYDDDGKPIPELMALWNDSGSVAVHDMALEEVRFMVSSRTSPDNRIHTFAALPYKGEVLDFLSTDPMVWIVVIGLGVLMSILAFFGVRTVCRNVYALRDFAREIASDRLPDDVDSWHFSKDELGDVSRHLLMLYRDKIHAEQEKMHHERQIGMNVSHELKTPVSIVKGYLETVLREENMPDALKNKFIARAYQNTNRLANLIKDVGMVMRLQENGSSVKCVPLNFYDIVVSLAEDVTKGHLSGSMAFNYQIPKDCYVLGHETLLVNALLNLIYNASQYSEGTEMSLEWQRKEDGRHVFAFADNGVGVGEEHITRLFDLFYRVDRGRSRKNGGSGLGLPLVRRVIMAMHGDISVENADTGGLKFTFSLPVAPKR